MSFFVRVLVNAVAIWLTTLLMGSHFEIVGGDGTGGRVVVFLVVALIFGVINAIIKPIVQLFTFPLYILTLGLFTLVVNALMVLLTGWLTEQADWGLRVDGFWWAVLAAFLISVISTIISVVVPTRSPNVAECTFTAGLPSASRTDLRGSPGVMTESHAETRSRHGSRASGENLEQRVSSCISGAARLEQHPSSSTSRAAPLQPHLSSATSAAAPIRAGQNGGSSGKGSGVSPGASAFSSSDDDDDLAPSIPPAASSPAATPPDGPLLRSPRSTRPVGCRGRSWAGRGSAGWSTYRRPAGEVHVTASGRANTPVVSPPRWRWRPTSLSRA